MDKVTNTRIKEICDGTWSVITYGAGGEPLPHSDYYTDTEEDAVDYATTTLAAHADGPILIHIEGDKKGQRAIVGDIITSFRGEKAQLSYFCPPHKESSQGKCSITWMEEDENGGEYYVGVFGMKWFNRE
tara:strand:- start:16031 stop:16420 length:390 start_codon:yes stop_codon:yes gene_type:complete